MSRHVPWVLFLLAGCSTRVDPCAALACGEGHCVIDTGSPRCVCAEARWSDGVCVRPDPCEVVSCGGLVGSSCEVHDGLARCVCPAGALADEGSCVATNPCLPNPCTVVRRTTCEVVNGGASCRCDRGYAPEGNGCSAVPLWTCNTQHTGNGQDAAEPDECPPLASALAQNQVVQRTLVPSGDHDWFRVTPWLNEVTRFSVATDDTTLGLLVELYDESGATLLAADNRGSSVASVAFTSRTGDAVMVRVRAVGGATGSYTARTESLGVDDFVEREEEADHVLLPITVQGTSLHPRDLDVLWLDVPAQKAVTLRFEGEGARLELKRAGVTVRTLHHEEALSFSTPFDESVLAVVMPEIGEPLGTFRLVATVNGFDDHSNDVAFATRITADNAWQVGQTDTASDVDSFVISQQRAHRYVARWQALSGSTVPMATVNEANGALIGASPNNATEFGWFGTSDADAYLRLQNPNSGGATSRFQIAVDDLGADDHSDEFDGATPVTFAMPGSGALSWNGDVDVFSFNATAGRVVKISVAQVMGEPAPGVRLHGPNGPVASASNVIHALIEVSGPHFILVGPSGLSRYSVTLADVGPDDHGGTDATATPLLLDTVITGSTQFTGDLDVFTATVTAGVVYQLEYSHSAQTREVRITQNGAGITASPLPVGARFSPQTSGAIVLTVTSFTPGDFQLRLAADGLDDVGNVPANATVLTRSMPRSATLDFDRDVDVFRFQADARRVYTITATSPLALQLQLTQLNVSGAAVRSATAPPLTIARDTAGEIIFSVSSRAQLSGAFQVTVTELGLDDHSGDPATAQLFAIATPVAGSADFPGDVDTLQFDAPAFRHLRARCISSSGACTVLLSDDAGWTASSPFGPDSSVTFRIDTPRRLFVSVTSELAGATWQLQLQDLAADDVGDTRTSALALPVDGMTRTFSFEAEGDVDVFKLTLNAGDIVWLTLNRFRLRVRSPNNAVSENRQFRATAAGDYLVEVFVENTATGPYQLTAQQGSDDFGNTIAAASPLPSGTVISGRRDYTNDLDSFSIDVTAGQPVNVETSELCQLRLLSSTGSTLETSYEPVLWVPTATGRIYVVVGPCDEPTYALVATY